MTIEIWHKGKVVNEMQLDARMQLKDLSVSFRFKSVMKGDASKEIPLPKIHRADNSRVDREPIGITSNPVISRSKTASFERPAAVYSNPRPYDF